MKALNFTLNSVTMLALVLMVGIVIDDAIVVLENIFRFIEEKKMRPREAAREKAALLEGKLSMLTQPWRRRLVDAFTLVLPATNVRKSVDRIARSHR